MTLVALLACFKKKGTSGLGEANYVGKVRS